jgi:hypothetical protein
VQLLKPKRTLEDIERIQKERQKQEIKSTLEKESKEQKPQQGFSLDR